MFKNHFKTALRNLWRNKTFSSINILGLALGLACSLLIMLWVSDEYKVDAFHTNDSQLYSVFQRRFDDGQIIGSYATPGLLAGELKRVMPEVQYAAAYTWNELHTFEANNKIIKQNGSYAEQDFFTMFSYPLLQGNAVTALRTSVDIAISKKMAEDFFGSSAAAIGKTIRYENKKDLKIAAVFDNVSPNSTVQFDYIINWPTFMEENGWAKSWTNNGPFSCVMVRKGTDAKAFEKKITRFLDAYNKKQTPQYYVRLGIQPYKNVYLRSEFDKNGEIAGGRIQYVKLFSAVAIFLLLIACVNFTNLTIAGSIKRAKEIGVRKAIGGARMALVKQFMGEALLVVIIAVCISLALVMLTLPAFNQLTGKQIHIPFNNPMFWLSIAGLLLATGFISGSYPALYLSSFKPVGVLKGLPRFSGKALWFRKGLVVFQFTLSMFLIIGTIVVNKQVKYIQTIHVGYDRENLLYVPLEGELPDKYELFSRQVLQMPGIQDVTRTSSEPTRIVNGTTGVQWEGKGPDDHTDFAHAAVSYDFVKTMRLQLAQGRDFSKDLATDSVGYLINESALEIIGYKDPIGKPLTFWKKKGTIIGVVKDFHFKSLHEQIKPLVLRLGQKNEGWKAALVRTERGKTKEALASLEKVSKALNPKFPFTYKFADEEYAKFYKSEQVVSQLANWFAFLGIFISCLGLLGLITFTAEQRTKEIGIRKVLGASPVALFNLLSREFLWLVSIAMVIASPLAWVAMMKWLQDYAYRTNVSWWIFVMAGVITVLIALITVSFQAVKAAMANPVKSLRIE